MKLRKLRELLNTLAHDPWVTHSGVSCAHGEGKPTLITMVRAFEKLIRLRWSIETIYVLADKPLRYSEIQHELALETKQKVHATTLTASLARLQAQRLINHDSDKDGHYRLTEAGQELVQELDQIARWSERHRRTLGL